MKIYGKESDYYDSALAYGSDPLCKWTREFNTYSMDALLKDDGCEKEFKLPESVFIVKPDGRNMLGHKSLRSEAVYFDYRVRTTSYKTTSYIFQSGFVFFCGKTYPFMRVNYNYSEKECFYTLESLIKFMNKTFSEKETQSLMDAQASRWAMRRITNKVAMENHFATKIDCEDLHRVNGIPVYVMCGDSLHEGGSLKNVNFVKVFDPYTCLQEISMYTSGVLGGNSPFMVDIADEHRLEGKGFDKVASFRNMKRN